MNILRFACGAESPPFDGSFRDWVKGQIKAHKGVVDDSGNLRGVGVAGRPKVRALQEQGVHETIMKTMNADFEPSWTDLQNPTQRPPMRTFCRRHNLPVVSPVQDGPMNCF